MILSFLAVSLLNVCRSYEVVSLVLCISQKKLLYWRYEAVKGSAFFEAIQSISLHCVKVVEALYNHSKFSLESGFFNTASSAAPQIPMCRRMLGSNLGLMRL